MSELNQDEKQRLFMTLDAIRTDGQVQSARIVKLETRMQRTEEDVKEHATARAKSAEWLFQRIEDSDKTTASTIGKSDEKTDDRLRKVEQKLFMAAGALAAIELGLRFFGK